MLMMILCGVQLGGANSHHIVEATFKAFARALRRATEARAARHTDVSAPAFVPVYRHMCVCVCVCVMRGKTGTETRQRKNREVDNIHPEPPCASQADPRRINSVPSSKGVLTQT